MKLFRTLFLIGIVLQCMEHTFGIHEEIGQECVPCTSTLMITVPDSMLISINTSTIPCGEKCRISLATEAQHAVVAVTLHGSNTHGPDANGRCKYSRLVSGIFNLCGNETTSVILGPVDDRQVFLEDDLYPPSSLNEENIFLFSIATSTTEQAKECAGVIDMSPEKEVEIKSIQYSFLANVFVDCTRTLKVPWGYDVLLNCPSVNFPPAGVNGCKMRMEIGELTFCEEKMIKNLTVPAVQGQVHIRVVLDNNRKITEFIRGSLAQWSQRVIYHCTATLVERVIQATTEPCEDFTTETLDDKPPHTVTPYVEVKTEHVRSTPMFPGAHIFTPIMRKGGFFPSLPYVTTFSNRNVGSVTLPESSTLGSVGNKDISEGNDFNSFSKVPTTNEWKLSTKTTGEIGTLIVEPKLAVSTRSTTPNHRPAFRDKSQGDFSLVDGIHTLNPRESLPSLSPDDHRVMSRIDWGKKDSLNVPSSSTVFSDETFSETAKKEGIAHQISSTAIYEKEMGEAGTWQSPLYTQAEGETITLEKSNYHEVPLTSAVGTISEHIPSATSLDAVIKVPRGSSKYSMGIKEYTMNTIVQKTSSVKPKSSMGASTDASTFKSKMEGERFKSNSLSLSTSSDIFGRVKGDSEFVNAVKANTATTKINTRNFSGTTPEINGTTFDVFNSSDGEMNGSTEMALLIQLATPLPLTTQEAKDDKQTYFEEIKILPDSSAITNSTLMESNRSHTSKDGKFPAKEEFISSSAAEWESSGQSIGSSTTDKEWAETTLTDAGQWMKDVQDVMVSDSEFMIAQNSSINWGNALFEFTSDSMSQSIQGHKSSIETQTTNKLDLSTLSGERRTLKYNLHDIIGRKIPISESNATDTNLGKETFTTDSNHNSFQSSPDTNGTSLKVNMTTKSTNSKISSAMTMRMSKKQFVGDSPDKQTLTVSEQGLTISKEKIPVPKWVSTSAMQTSGSPVHREDFANTHSEIESNTSFPSSSNPIAEINEKENVNASEVGGSNITHANEDVVATTTRIKFRLGFEHENVSFNQNETTESPFDFSKIYLNTKHLENVFASHALKTAKENSSELEGTTRVPSTNVSSAATSTFTRTPISDGMKNSTISLALMPSSFKVNVTSASILSSSEPRLNFTILKIGKAEAKESTSTETNRSTYAKTESPPTKIPLDRITNTTDSKVSGKQMGMITTFAYDFLTRFNQLNLHRDFETKTSRGVKDEKGTIRPLLIDLIKNKTDGNIGNGFIMSLSTRSPENIKTNTETRDTTPIKTENSTETNSKESAGYRTEIISARRSNADYASTTNNTTEISGIQRTISRNFALNTEESPSSNVGVPKISSPVTEADESSDYLTANSTRASVITSTVKHEDISLRDVKVPKGEMAKDTGFLPKATTTQQSTIISDITSVSAITNDTNADISDESIRRLVEESTSIATGKIEALGLVQSKGTPAVIRKSSEMGSNVNSSITQVPNIGIQDTNRMEMLETRYQSSKHDVGIITVVERGNTIGSTTEIVEVDSSLEKKGTDSTSREMGVHQTSTQNGEKKGVENEALHTTLSITQEKRIKAFITEQFGLSTTALTVDEKFPNVENESVTLTNKTKTVHETLRNVANGTVEFQDFEKTGSEYNTMNGTAYTDSYTVFDGEDETVKKMANLTESSASFSTSKFFTVQTTPDYKINESKIWHKGIEPYSARRFQVESENNLDGNKKTTDLPIGNVTSQDIKTTAKVESIKISKLLDVQGTAATTNVVNISEIANTSTEFNKRSTLDGDISDISFFTTAMTSFESNSIMPKSENTSEVINTSTSIRVMEEQETTNQSYVILEPKNLAFEARKDTSEGNETSKLEIQNLVLGSWSEVENITAVANITEHFEFKGTLNSSSNTGEGANDKTVSNYVTSKLERKMTAETEIPRTSVSIGQLVNTPSTVASTDESVQGVHIHKNVFTSGVTTTERAENTNTHSDSTFKSGTKDDRYISFTNKTTQEMSTKNVVTHSGEILQAINFKTINISTNILGIPVTDFTNDTQRIFSPTAWKIREVKDSVISESTQPVTVTAGFGENKLGLEVRNVPHFSKDTDENHSSTSKEMLPQSTDPSAIVFEKLTTAEKYSHLTNVTKGDKSPSKPLNITTKTSKSETTTAPGYDLSTTFGDGSGFVSSSDANVSTEIMLTESVSPDFSTDELQQSTKITADKISSKEFLPGTKLSSWTLKELNKGSGFIESKDPDATEIAADNRKPTVEDSNNTTSLDWTNPLKFTTEIREIFQEDSTALTPNIIVKGFSSFQDKDENEMNRRRDDLNSSELPNFSIGPKGNKSAIPSAVNSTTGGDITQKPIIEETQGILISISNSLTQSEETIGTQTSQGTAVRTNSMSAKVESELSATTTPFSRDDDIRQFGQNSTMQPSVLDYDNQTIQDAIFSKVTESSFNTAEDMSLKQTSGNKHTVNSSFHLPENIGEKEDKMSTSRLSTQIPSTKSEPRTFAPHAPGEHGELNRDISTGAITRIHGKENIDLVRDGTNTPSISEKDKIETLFDTFKESDISTSELSLDTTTSPITFDSNEIKDKLDLHLTPSNTRPPSDVLKGHTLTQKERTSSKKQEKTLISSTTLLHDETINATNTAKDPSELFTIISTSPQSKKILVEGFVPNFRRVTKNLELYNSGPLTIQSLATEMKIIDEKQKLSTDDFAKISESSDQTTNIQSDISNRPTEELRFMELVKDSNSYQSSTSKIPNETHPLLKDVEFALNSISSTPVSKLKALEKNTSPLLSRTQSENLKDQTRVQGFFRTSLNTNLAEWTTGTPKRSLILKETVVRPVLLTNKTTENGQQKAKIAQVPFAPKVNGTSVSNQTVQAEIEKNIYDYLTPLSSFETYVHETREVTPVAIYPENSTNAFDTEFFVASHSTGIALTDAVMDHNPAPIIQDIGNLQTFSESSTLTYKPGARTINQIHLGSLNVSFDEDTRKENTTIRESFFTDTIMHKMANTQTPKNISLSFSEGSDSVLGENETRTVPTLRSSLLLNGNINFADEGTTTTGTESVRIVTTPKPTMTIISPTIHPTISEGKVEGIHVKSSQTDITKSQVTDDISSSKKGSNAESALEKKSTIIFNEVSNFTAGYVLTSFFKQLEEAQTSPIKVSQGTFAKASEETPIADVETDALSFQTKDQNSTSSVLSLKDDSFLVKMITDNPRNSDIFAAEVYSSDERITTANYTDQTSDGNIKLFDTVSSSRVHDISPTIKAMSPDTTSEVQRTSNFSHSPEMIKGIINDLFLKQNTDEFRVMHVKSKTQGTEVKASDTLTPTLTSIPDLPSAKDTVSSGGVTVSIPVKIKNETIDWINTDAENQLITSVHPPIAQTGAGISFQSSLRNSSNFFKALTDNSIDESDQKFSTKSPDVKETSFKVKHLQVPHSKMQHTVQSESLPETYSTEIYKSGTEIFSQKYVKGNISEEVKEKSNFLYTTKKGGRIKERVKSVEVWDDVAFQFGEDVASTEHHTGISKGYILEGVTSTNAKNNFPNLISSDAITNAVIMNKNETEHGTTEQQTSESVAVKEEISSKGKNTFTTSYTLDSIPNVVNATKDEDETEHATIEVQASQTTGVVSTYETFPTLPPTIAAKAFSQGNTKSETTLEKKVATSLSLHFIPEGDKIQENVKSLEIQDDFTFHYDDDITSSRHQIPTSKSDIAKGTTSTEVADIFTATSSHPPISAAETFTQGDVKGETIYEKNEVTSLSPHFIPKKGKIEESVKHLDSRDSFTFQFVDDVTPKGERVPMSEINIQNEITSPNAVETFPSLKSSKALSNATDVLKNESKMNDIPTSVAKSFSEEGEEGKITHEPEGTISPPLHFISTEDKMQENVKSLEVQDDFTFPFADDIASTRHHVLSSKDDIPKEITSPNVSNNSTTLNPSDAISVTRNESGHVTGENKTSSLDEVKATGRVFMTHSPKSVAGTFPRDDAKHTDLHEANDTTLSHDAAFKKDDDDENTPSLEISKGFESKSSDGEAVTTMIAMKTLEGEVTRESFIKKNLEILETGDSQNTTPPIKEIGSLSKNLSAIEDIATDDSLGQRDEHLLAISQAEDTTFTKQSGEHENKWEDIKTFPIHPTSEIYSLPEEKLKDLETKGNYEFRFLDRNLVKQEEDVTEYPLPIEDRFKGSESTVQMSTQSSVLSRLIENIVLDPSKTTLVQEESTYPKIASSTWVSPTGESASSVSVASTEERYESVASERKTGDTSMNTSYIPLDAQLNHEQEEPTNLSGGDLSKGNKESGLTSTMPASLTTRFEDLFNSIENALFSVSGAKETTSSSLGPSQRMTSSEGSTHTSKSFPSGTSSGNEESEIFPPATVSIKFKGAESKFEIDSSKFERFFAGRDTDDITTLISAMPPEVTTRIAPDGTITFSKQLSGDRKILKPEGVKVDESAISPTREDCAKTLKKIKPTKICFCQDLPVNFN